MQQRIVKIIDFPFPAEARPAGREIAIVKQILALLAVLLLALPAALQAAEPPTIDTPGLVAWLDAGDAEAAIALAKKQKSLVHVLVSHAERAEMLRETAQAAGLSGVVTVQTLPSMETLPFSERSVNTVVADLSSLKVKAPMRQEILRVLAPTGVAWVKCDDTWEAWHPEPDRDTDVWTHKWYDATGNAVSKDQRIKTPNALRWIAGPQSDVGARPQQGFRVNDGLAVVEWEFTSEGPRQRRQFLVARDAFSGVVRWTRDSGPIAPADYLASDPYKLVVLEDGTIYTALHEGSRIVAIDAKTGTDLRTYEQSVPVSSQVRWFIAVYKGRLIQTAGSEVRVIDTATGKLNWSWTNPGAAKAETAEDGTGRKKGSSAESVGRNPVAMVGSVATEAWVF